MARGLDLVAKEPERALEELRQAKPDNDFRKAYGIGIANEALGRIEEATKALEDAVSKKKDFVPARTALARVRIVSGNVAGAHAELRSIIADSPGWLTPVLLYAVTAADPPQCKAALDALRAWPGHRTQDEAKKALPAEYLLTLSFIEQLAGDTSAARKTLKQAAAPALASPAEALMVARFAAKLGKKPLGHTLTQRLAKSQLTSVLARAVAEVGLEIEQPAAALLAAKQLPRYPEDPQNLLLLGRCEMANGDADAAHRTLARAVARLPAKSTARDEAEYALAKALLRLERAQQAEALLAELAKRQPERLSVQLLLASAELAGKKTSAAIERLTRLQQKNPSTAELQEGLGSAYLAANDNAAAEREFRKLVELHPQSVRATELLVRALTLQGKHAQVATELEAATVRNPKDMALLKMLVDHYLGRRQPDQAVAALEKRVRESPDHDMVALLLAATYEKVGRKAELRKTLEELAKRRPNSRGGALALARLEELSGDVKAMEAALLRCLEADPEASEVRIRLATHYDSRREPAKAAAQYEEVLKYDGANAVALNNAAVLYASELDRPERAVDLAERAVKVAPGRAEIEDTLGWALIRRAKPADLSRAVDLLRHVNMALKSPPSTLHLATGLYLAGKKDESEKLLKGYSFDRDNPEHRLALGLLGRAGGQSRAKPSGT